MLEVMETIDHTPLPLTKEAQSLYYSYLEYNKLLAEDIDAQHEISQLSRTHSHWKTLKLSGAFATLRNSQVIDKEDFIYAINFTELYAEDLQAFEVELEKETYEVFIDYMHLMHKSGKESIKISAHKLKKLGFIKGTGAIHTKLKDLVDISTSADKTGIYTVVDDTIVYEKIRKTNINGASFLEVTGTKQERAYQCAEGFTYADTSFEYLKNLLAMDLAFSPFEFREGKRGKNNIIGGTSWAILDIDESNLTDEEVHFILEDINHHIARTSNPDNGYKFRVIIQLDAYVELAIQEFPYFMQSISESLGLKSDKLSILQIYFGYEGREVLSQTTGHKVEVKDHLLFAKAKVTEKEKARVELSPKERKAALDSPFATFDYAFEAENGEGTRKMISAAYKAKDLGATNDEIVTLMEEINDYWDVSMDPQRFENTILRFARNV
jgi:hypothetical protein